MMIEPELDSIRTEYHPHSQRPPKLVKFKDFRRQEPAEGRPPKSSLEDPWQPFQSRADFEFAELALEAALNKRQVEKLIGIFEHCKSGQDTFSIKNHKDLRDLWKDASALVTPVSF